MSAEGIKDQAEIPGRDAPIEQAAPAPELSLRDELKNRLEAVKTAPEGETAEAREIRVRDEQGRFAEKPKEAKPARPVLTVKPTNEINPAAAANAAAAANPANQGIPAVATAKPPDGWNAAAKAKFATLEPDIQAEITRRESDMHRQFTTQDQDRTLGKGIREVAAPYLATIKAEGGDEKAAFAQFLNYAHIMRQGTAMQKLQALHQVAQAYNVELGQPLQQASQFQAAIQPQEIRALVQAELDQQRQVQEQSALTSEIDAFKNAPGHEHYEQVKVLMGNLLLSEQAKDLQEAYDQAIWANPEIRSTLTAAQAAAKEQERLTAANARTDAARRAAGSITGGPGGVKPNGVAVERSLGEEIRANMQAAIGRV